ncbi:MAG TPA: ribosome silencing factor [Bacteroidia bacterium]|jgi:ribosome-associated protein|nr:ribosome silencing factor [Bacteroidia bacterium]
MHKTGGKINPVQLKDAVIRSMADKNAKNIVCLNMEKVENNICDYFVICEGTSSVQVNAIAEAVEEEVYKLTGQYAYHSEGQKNAEWILQDYVDVVVHIFQPDVRTFYNLEGLWGDAELEEIMIEKEYKRM